METFLIMLCSTVISFEIIRLTQPFGGLGLTSFGSAERLMTLWRTLLAMIRVRGCLFRLYFRTVR